MPDGRQRPGRPPRYAKYTYQRGASRWQAIPCPHCHAADGRDAAHARGCPKLPAATKEQLLELARTVEAAWARKAGR